MKNFRGWYGGKFYRREFLKANNITFPNIKIAEDMVFCFKCLMLAKNYVRIPNVTNIHRIMTTSLGRKAETFAGGIEVWLDVVMNVVANINQTMRDIKFFVDNPKYHCDVLEFVISKHFEFIKNLSGHIAFHDLQKIFYDALNNPKLDKYSEAKNIIAAHLFTRRALRI